MVVWKLGCLARDLRGLLKFVGQLKTMDALFAWLTDQSDTTNSIGWLVFQTFNALVEYERDRIAGRTLAGLAATRTCGHKGGRLAKLTGAALERAG